MKKRNWAFASNSNFPIIKSLQPECVNLWYFKLRLSDLTEFIVWSILGLETWVGNILGFKNQSFLAKSLFFYTQKMRCNILIICIVGLVEPNQSVFLQEIIFKTYESTLHIRFTGIPGYQGYQDTRDTGDTRDTKDIRDTKDSRNTRNTRGTGDTRNTRDTRDTKDSKDIRYTRDTRETGNTRIPGIPWIPWIPGIPGILE